MTSRSKVLGSSLAAALLVSVVGACSSDPEQASPAPPDVTSAPGCGRLTTPCEVGGACEGAPDCKSGACRDAKCIEITPADNSQNNDETDVDCGGTKAPACDDGKKCAVAADCKSGVCTGGVCAAPSPADGVKNGDETGKDCGGAKAPKCPTGEGCLVDGDCNAVKCDPATKKCAGPTHEDGLKNGDETGVDCGGPTATKKCAPGDGCNATSDCDNVLCDTTAKKCKPPAADDGLKNGSETDVDCGGGAPTNAARCDAPKACDVDSDCKSGGCNHKKQCAFARSCTAQHGGTTCGTGDATSPANQNEDCCASEEVPVYNADGYSNAAAFRLDKYQISAGRIRKFLTAVNGNVKGWVQANRANVLAPDQLPASMDPYLPAGWTQADSADLCYPDGTAPGDPAVPCNYGALNQVSGFRYNNEPGGDNGYGCYVQPSGYSTRTYWTSAAENAATGQGESVMVVSKDRADEKAMTCTTYYILAAFCAWDGGRLETWDEYNAAFGGNGSIGRTYPWGSDAASRPIGFSDLGSSTVSPLSSYGYTPPASGDPNIPQYSTYNPNLTAQQKADLLLRLQRANMSWNYYGSQILDYIAPLQGRGEKVLTAESNIDAAKDQSIAVAPPGRYPMGAGKYGHRDLLGNVMEITATANGATRRRWTRNASFETSHYVQPQMVGYASYNFLLLTKYGRTGGRCARPLGVYPAAPLP
jgi:hypothetical protein